MPRIGCPEPARGESVGLQLAHPALSAPAESGRLLRRVY